MPTPKNIDCFLFYTMRYQNLFSQVCASQLESPIGAVKMEFASLEIRKVKYLKKEEH